MKKGQKRQMVPFSRMYALTRNYYENIRCCIIFGNFLWICTLKTGQKDFFCSRNDVKFVIFEKISISDSIVRK